MWYAYAYAYAYAVGVMLDDAHDFLTTYCGVALLGGRWSAAYHQTHWQSWRLCSAR